MSIDPNDYTIESWQQACILRLSDAEVKTKDMFKWPVIDSNGYFLYDQMVLYSTMLEENSYDIKLTREQIVDASYRLEYIKDLITEVI